MKNALFQKETQKIGSVDGGNLSKIHLEPKRPQVEGGGKGPMGRQINDRLYLLPIRLLNESGPGGSLGENELPYLMWALFDQCPPTSRYHWPLSWYMKIYINDNLYLKLLNIYFIKNAFFINRIKFLKIWLNSRDSNALDCSSYSYRKLPNRDILVNYIFFRKFGQIIFQYILLRILVHKSYSKSERKSCF